MRFCLCAVGLKFKRIFAKLHITHMHFLVISSIKNSITFLHSFLVLLHHRQKAMNLKNLLANCDKVIHKIFGSSDWASRNRKFLPSKYFILYLCVVRKKNIFRDYSVVFKVWLQFFIY